MKKIALLTVLVIGLSIMVGCGNQDKEDDTKTSSELTVTTTSDSSIVNSAKVSSTDTNTANDVEEFKEKIKLDVSQTELDNLKNDINNLEVEDLDSFNN